MAELGKTSPNRMELLKNRRRLVLATRGHKLLKDKYDELVKRFIQFIRNNKGLRTEAEQLIKSLYTDFTLLRAQTSSAHLASLIKMAPVKTEIKSEFKNLLNTKVPILALKAKNTKNYPLSSLLVFDKFLERLSLTLKILAKLAQYEHTVRILASEIEKTRRRVNALEHILIPQLSSNIRFISMKMDEIDRETRTRLMRTKELLTSEAYV